MLSNDFIDILWNTSHLYGWAARKGKMWLDDVINAK